MPKHGHTKLVPQSMELLEEQSLEVTEESRFLEQREWIMELNVYDVMVSWNLIPVFMH